MDSSGHGGQTEDLDGDEDDGNDEVIYPVDFKQQGHIVDDESESLSMSSRSSLRAAAIRLYNAAATLFTVQYAY